MQDVEAKIIEFLDDCWDMEYYEIGYDMLKANMQKYSYINNISSMNSSAYYGNIMNMENPHN